MTEAAGQRLAVLVDTPQHSGLSQALSYRSPEPWPPGTLVRVPLGKRELLGLVWDDTPHTPEGEEVDALQLREVLEAFAALPPLSASWRALLDFAAAYYQRSAGELALAVLPPQLREIDARQLQAKLKKLDKAYAGVADGSAAMGTKPVLTTAQQAALAPVTEALEAASRAAAGAEGAAGAPAPLLLWGLTGSGKTEIYLRAAEEALARGRQVLVLVPEINLTPQLEARFAERFAGQAIVSLHSALTPAQRLQNWLAAHLGRARLVLGTRLAVFASLPELGLIVVDEEHDPSYKQQDGARYSARDLAVYRAHLARIPVLLGSATPSLESWAHACSGRYRRVDLAERMGGGVLPRVRLFDMNRLERRKGVTTAISVPLLDALRERLARGEQSLIFLNRRGYAPVLHCDQCNWKSDCPHCSAHQVFHKGDRTLRCHHCGVAQRVPRACPDCGNTDIAPLGRGTERLEEQLAELLPGARVARIDADTTRHKGALEASLSSVHEGEVDILVGTQMVTKGHDFRRITLVAAVNPDGALFSSDFRAPERLFALLMQAAGRAGRDAAQAQRSEMWVQTWYPQHAVYQALQRHDYAAFASAQLAERASAGLPPHVHLALLRAEGRTPDAVREFLLAARQAALDLAQAQVSGVHLYPPVPMAVARIANVERQQMLVEAEQRAPLQRLLRAWLPELQQLKRAHKGVLRWAVDVDPLAI